VRGERAGKSQREKTVHSPGRAEERSRAEKTRNSKKKRLEKRGAKRHFVRDSSSCRDLETQRNTKKGSNGHNLKGNGKEEQGELFPTSISTNLVKRKNGKKGDGKNDRKLNKKNNHVEGR